MKNNDVVEKNEIQNYLNSDLNSGFIPGTASKHYLSQNVNRQVGLYNRDKCCPH